MPGAATSYMDIQTCSGTIHLPWMVEQAGEVVEGESEVEGEGQGPAVPGILRRDGIIGYGSDGKVRAWSQ